MKKEKEPKEPKPQKPKSNQFMLSDKEVEANEKLAGYDNEGPFGIGMIKGK